MVSAGLLPGVQELPFTLAKPVVRISWNVALEWGEKQGTGWCQRCFSRSTVFSAIGLTNVAWHTGKEIP